MAATTAHAGQDTSSMLMATCAKVYMYKRGRDTVVSLHTELRNVYTEYKKYLEYRGVHGVRPRNVHGVWDCTCISLYVEY